MNKEQQERLLNVIYIITSPIWIAICISGLILSSIIALIMGVIEGTFTFLITPIGYVVKDTNMFRDFLDGERVYGKQLSITVRVGYGMSMHFLFQDAIKRENKRLKLELSKSKPKDNSETKLPEGQPISNRKLNKELKNKKAFEKEWDK